MIKSISFTLLAFFCFEYITAQVDRNSSLFRDLRKQDSIFFERGFNRCDLEYLDRHVTEDLRFFHDQSGFQDRNTFFENTEKYICSDPDRKPVRKLEHGSLTVFPLYENGVLYGAIQSGIHHFYIREAGSEDRWTSTAHFTHIWLWEEGLWKLSEVLSYDHREPDPEKERG